MTSGLEKNINYWQLRRISVQSILGTSSSSHLIDINMYLLCGLSSCSRSLLKMKCRARAPEVSLGWLWVLPPPQIYLGKAFLGPRYPKCWEHTQVPREHTAMIICLQDTQDKLLHITALVPGDTQDTKLSCLHWSRLKIMQSTQLPVSHLQHNARLHCSPQHRQEPLDSLNLAPVLCSPFTPPTQATSGWSDSLGRQSLCAND